MNALMRTLPALLLPALLASCVAAPESGPPGGSTIGSASAPSVTEQAALLREQARQQSNASSGTSAPAPSASPDVPVDRNRKLETVDVFTDLKDPSTQKQLVSFLMKPDEWMVVRVDMPSATTRWWRFQRVARTDGRSMPDVDPLRRR
jgi:hypothetical protein